MSVAARGKRMRSRPVIWDSIPLAMTGPPWRAPLSRGYLTTRVYGPGARSGLAVGATLPSSLPETSVPLHSDQSHEKGQGCISSSNSTVTAVIHDSLSKSRCAAHAVLAVLLCSIVLN